MRHRVFCIWTKTCIWMYMWCTIAFLILVRDMHIPSDLYFFIVGLSYINMRQIHYEYGARIKPWYRYHYKVPVLHVWKLVCTEDQGWRLKHWYKCIICGDCVETASSGKFLGNWRLWVHPLRPTYIYFRNRKIITLFSDRKDNKWIHIHWNMIF